MIHHCLNAANGRTDAHGIVAGAVRNLVVRDTKIHTFSGDAIQLDPDRGRARLGPDHHRSVPVLAGTAAQRRKRISGRHRAGENALDTKTLATAPRATVIVRQTEAWGFRGGLLTNMAAFNIKENVDATFDGVTVSRSEIAFRLRGPGPNGGAWARVQNAVVYDVGTGVRYEDNIERVQVWNTTFGSAIPRFFRAASSTAIGLDVRNVLFLGSEFDHAGRAGQRAGHRGVLRQRRGARLPAGSRQPRHRRRRGDQQRHEGSDRRAAAQGAYWDVGAYEFVQ